MRKVLYVCHNHLASAPGGVEAYAAELYATARESGRFTPVMVSRVGLPHSDDQPHDGTRFALAGEDPNEYFIHTGRDEFDRLMWAAHDKRLYTEDWRGFLRALEPDLIHFHHTAWLGFDVLRETRRTLPHAPIVYTLHDFGPICHHNGQMVTTEALELCSNSSPRRCHRCFPTIPAQTFFMRERFIKSAFEHVDLFLAPSYTLRRQYVEWGIPPDKIRVEEYGRVPVAASPDPPDAGRRRRIGYFGQVTRFKGIDVLLEAMKLLDRREAGVRLRLAAANLEINPLDVQQRIRELLDRTPDSVLFTGRYAREELPSLMSAIDWVIVPSIWWENSPLVIQEAMMHRRPVICSNIGGMAEKVRNGVDGLHFRARDPHSLAGVIEHATGSPELWDELRGGISDPYNVENHLRVLDGIYSQLLSGAATPPAQDRPPAPAGRRSGRRTGRQSSTGSA